MFKTKKKLQLNKKNIYFMTNHYIFSLGFYLLSCSGFDFASELSAVYEIQIPFINSEWFYFCCFYCGVGGEWHWRCIADSFGFVVIRRSCTVLAAHCLEIRSRKLQAEELKIGLGKLLKDFYTHEEGAMIISVSILC